MSSKTGAVIKQASFLMIAGLLCRVIGLLYRSPLREVIGETGAGYYTFANEWYSILLLISAYSIPSAVSKVMAERLALKRYKDAQRVFYASLCYALVVGGLAAIVCYAAAPMLLSKTPGAVLALRVLAPTILLSAILGVMRGFFQAHNTMKPTAISQIGEQIIHAVVSIVAAYGFIKLATNEEQISSYGAAGGTLGTGAGVLFALLFMLAVYMANRKTVVRNLKNDDTKHQETYGQVIKVILLMVTPVIFSTCVYNVSGVIDQTIYNNMSAWQGLTAVEASNAYGTYGYNCKPIINIPVALGSATATAIIPAVASHFALGEKKEAINRIDECIKFTMFIAIPAAVGLAVLSCPVIHMLYPSADYFESGVYLSISAVSVVFYCLSSVTNGVLQGLGKPKLPVIHAAIALGINVVTLLVLMWTGLGVAAVIVATVLYSVVVCILNAMAIRKILGYRTDVKSCYIYPIISALVMAVIVGVIYWIPYVLAPEVISRYIVSAVLAVAAVIAGVLVYLIMYLQTSKMPEEEIRKLPMGSKIVRVVKLLHLR